MLPILPFGPVSSPVARIIVVEDNIGLLEDVVFQLNNAGFFVRGVADGSQMDALLKTELFDIVVLDVNLPLESGFQIARRLRSVSSFGIIMLSARSELDDKLQGHENGADVYLVKPIDRLELIACINSLWRRIMPAAEKYCWRLETRSRLLTSPENDQLYLTPQDIRIFQLLLGGTPDIFSRNRIIEALGIEYTHTPDARINMMMSRLRQKLVNFNPSLIIRTWRNSGYSYSGPRISQIS